MSDSSFLSIFEIKLRKILEQQKEAQKDIIM